MKRGPVSIVVPFAGSRADADALLDALGELELEHDDEVLVVDNSPDVVVPREPGPARVVRAAREQSSYHARNVGVEATRGEWLLFLDADCRPQPRLLERYFEEPVNRACGIVAGGVIGAPWQPALVPRWARSRGHVSELYHVVRGPRPAGITANLLVRREAWEQAGGFQEGIRNGGDLEFCWRVQELGWGFAHRPEASVEHVHVEALGALLRKGVGYGSGNTWVNRRYPGAAAPPALARELVRAAGGALVWMLTGRFERARFKLIDGAWYTAVRCGGFFRSNRAVRPAEQSADRKRVLVAGAYPARGTPDPARPQTVEARLRPAVPDRIRARCERIRYAEDDSPWDRASAAAAAWLRHPRRCVRDLRAGADAGEPLTELAPAARRLARARPRSLQAAGADDRVRTSRLGQLGGIPDHPHSIGVR